MNEQQAIDFATEHGVAVSTTRKTKQADTFKVGSFELIRRKGSRNWLIAGRTGTKFRVGEAIEYCVREEIKRAIRTVQRTREG